MLQSDFQSRLQADLLYRPQRVCYQVTLKLAVRVVIMLAVDRLSSVVQGQARVQEKLPTEGNNTHSIHDPEAS